MACSIPPWSAHTNQASRHHTSACTYTHWHMHANANALPLEPVAWVLHQQWMMVKGKLGGNKVTQWNVLPWLMWQIVTFNFLKNALEKVTFSDLYSQPNLKGSCSSVVGWPLLKNVFLLCKHFECHFGDTVWVFGLTCLQSSHLFFFLKMSNASWSLMDSFSIKKQKTFFCKSYHHVWE